MATSRTIPTFALEQAYREGYTADLLDLSSSAARATTVRDLLGDAAYETLLDCSLGYEPGGGSDGLRSAIAGLYDGLDACNVLITAGAAGGHPCRGDGAD